MSSNPDVLFDKEAQQFEEDVIRAMEKLKADHPSLSDFEARTLAEEMAVPFKPDNAKRPN